MVLLEQRRHEWLAASHVRPAHRRGGLCDHCGQWDRRRDHEREVCRWRGGTTQLAPGAADTNLNASSQSGAASGGLLLSATEKTAAQVSQVIAAPDLDAREPGREKPSFEDLDAQLQNVLRAQLQKPADVSAVIEISAGFLIFQAKAKTSDALTAALLSIPKRSYEGWLAQQPE